MLDNGSAENPTVDFTASGHRRRMLYFKRPLGAPIPAGLNWRCVCNVVNVLSDQTDQYCCRCGSRLRLQENADPNNQYYTCVVVSHLNTPRAKGQARPR